MRKRMIGGAAAVATAAAGLRLVRRWELRWGANDEEVELDAPGDDLVTRPHLVATRAVSIAAEPEQVWPWLVQIGRGRAGWYSYDRLDNAGKQSAREILASHQRMDVGDVVVMSSRDGEPYGPIVLALEPPCSLLWGDSEQPHHFTWLWLLRAEGQGQTRLTSRIRCRYSWRDPLFVLLMELADPIMMRRCLLGIAERAETQARAASRREPSTGVSS